MHFWAGTGCLYLAYLSGLSLSNHCRHQHYTSSIICFDAGDGHGYNKWVCSQKVIFKKFLSLEFQFIAIKMVNFKLMRILEELTNDFRAIQNRGTRFRCWSNFVWKKALSSLMVLRLNGKASILRFTLFELQFSFFFVFVSELNHSLCRKVLVLSI
jgi:hypothetical protein